MTKKRTPLFNFISDQTITILEVGIRRARNTHQDAENKTTVPSHERIMAMHEKMHHKP